jgi:hypothetical protein
MNSRLRKPHPQSQVEMTAEAFGRRASHSPRLRSRGRTSSWPGTASWWSTSSMARKPVGGPGRPRVPRAVEQLIVRMAEENRDWGYDRIAGALANLAHQVCDQTVGNVLQRHGLPPAVDN